MVNPFPKIILSLGWQGRTMSLITARTRQVDAVLLTGIFPDFDKFRFPENSCLVTFK